MARKKKKTELHVLKGVGPKTAERLKEAGYDSVESLAKVSPGKIQDRAGVSEKTAASLVSGAKDYLEKAKEKEAKPVKEVKKKPSKKEKPEKKKPEKKKAEKKPKPKERKLRRKKEKIEKEEIEQPEIIKEGVMLSYRRGGGRSISHVGLIQVNGVKTHRKGAQLIGKRVILTYPSGALIRGKVVSTHGKRGMLRVRFNKGLVGAAIGREVKII
ncbi:MAG: 50S ribosomal protein L35ae [Candidatus Hodarchaeota archaeon]